MEQVKQAGLMALCAIVGAAAIAALWAGALWLTLALRHALGVAL